MESNLRETAKRINEKCEENNIFYLIGGEAGSELALRGDILFRQKRLHDYIPNEVDNIDIYGLSYGTKRKVNFGEDITKYGDKKTKYLTNLDTDYLKCTYDVVTFGKERYQIPQLEILFLESALSNSPRAKELIKQYDLNYYKIMKLFETYYLDPAVSKMRLRSFDNEYSLVLVDIYVLLRRIIKSYLGYGNYSIEDVEKKANDTILKAREDMSNTFYKCKVKYLPYPIKINTLGDISDANKEEIKSLIANDLQSNLDALNKKAEIISEMFKEYGQNKRL